MKCYKLLLLLLCTVLLAQLGRAAAPATSVVDTLSFNGQADQSQASFMLKGTLKGTSPEEQEAKLIYAVQSQVKVLIDSTSVVQTVELKARVLQGKLKEMVLAIEREGEITSVTSPDLKDWSVRTGKFSRRGADTQRYLVIRPQEPATNAPPLTNFVATVQTKQVYKKLPVTAAPLTFSPENSAFFDGFIELKPDDTVELSITNLVGMSPVRQDTMPLSTSTGPVKEQPLRFRFAGTDYALSMEIREKDPDLRKVQWENFKLVGELKDRFASFVLSGQAVVKHPDGGVLAVLSGEAGLTGYPAKTDVRYEQGRYWLKFPKAGTYPVEFTFNAKVTPTGAMNGLNFEVVPSALCPLILKGLSSDTQFQFAGAAKPERQGIDFVSYLPASGKLQLQWKEAKTEELGKLFYSAEGLVQIAVGPGLLREAYLVGFKVMQGELNQLTFELTGEGEVTRVRGEDILSWRTEPRPENKRRLIVQLSQARKDQYALLIQTQTPLGVFPLQIQPLRLVPTGAIRYGGHLMVINDGAVRLEVTDAKALSQISPDLFPQSKELAEIAPSQKNQAFAYRFSGVDFSMRIHAENILPELSVSEVLVYNLGETETAIDAEVELEVREAPPREVYLRVPADYTVSRVNIAQLSDYSLTPETEAGWARLKLIFASPLSGRQLLQLRLEKNQNAAGAWTLPVVQPQNVKSVRGYVGVSAETGLRITAGTLNGLTDIASAFFPKKVAGLQAAYRLREESWQAKMNVERLAVSIIADVTHLFTLNEGLAYGSSIINYQISGTPISVLKVEVPAAYTNVEFAGRDLRSWKKTGTSYEVYLQTPVFGSYTLLATYDRQFSAQSNTVTFVGARPLDVQSEQGSVLVVSDYQFEVKPTEVSAGLLQLDPGEIPPEHRLLFDAPILAAYQYTGRPFGLTLALHSLGMGETVHQVVDRAELRTHISREGEVVTEANYYLKSQGHSHLRLSFTKDTQLWEARVNGSKVVPVSDRDQTLIPLPAKADPSAILTVQVKLASKSPRKERVKLAAPVLEKTPVMLTEWNVQPDEKYRLEYHGGTVAPSQRENRSGFLWLWGLLNGRFGTVWQTRLTAVPFLLALGLLLLRRGTAQGVYRWSIPHLAGSGLGLVAIGGGLTYLVLLMIGTANSPLPAMSGLKFIAPIQDQGTALQVEVKNLEVEKLGFSPWSVWPALLALLVWGYVPMNFKPGAWRKAGMMLGWVLLSWAALRLPNGTVGFFAIIMAFALLHLVIPALRCLVKVPKLVKVDATPTAATTTLLIALGLPLMFAGIGNAAPVDEPAKGTVLSLTQEARVQENSMYVKGQLEWKTEAGQKLDFLSAPAVLSKIDYPQSSLLLSASGADGTSGYRLSAKEAGQFTITFEYATTFSKDTSLTSFTLPTTAALINRLEVEVEKADVDVFSTQAVSVQTSRIKRGETESTKAEIVLLPVDKVNIAWRPRSRDTRTEKAVFYGELWHLFIPTAGVVEGVYDVQIRPAQGQLGEVSFEVPPGQTITDVQADFVSSWRFDPDQKILRVQFNTVQARPFTLRVRSQMATSPLPYQQTNGVLTLAQAANQVGMVGVATGSEVQLDTLKEEKLSVINLEDFPTAPITDNARQIPGLTLRRAFRYTDTTSKVILSATAVQPDVRVETQETFSLGEDRSLLASQLAVRIARAGLFKLSFLLPRDYEVESLSGTALSHWTELRSDAERVITMHLKGKTEGDQTFNVTLVGPGTVNRKQWEAPRLVLREANKQTGQILIVPEQQGMRLQIMKREAVTQVDPQRLGVRQKGVMAYRLLNSGWQLGFDIETVEAWVQVASLQDTTIREGQMLVNAQFDYQIENAGLKSLSIQLPAGAEKNVWFEGDYISDTVRTESGTNRLADWEVKLQRRVIGNYSLRASYQSPLTNQLGGFSILGVKAKGASLQRSYVAVRAGGRLQIQFPPQLPGSLQRMEWQSIPATLRRGRELTESKDAFSTLESDFELPFSVSRHELAKVLPARVEKVELKSVVASSGEMLTEGRLLLWPGDKRLLSVRLPASGQFWYAFVNGQSALPWQDAKNILLMLEKNSDPAKPTTVEFFYTCQTGAEKVRGFSHQFLGPSFDLPLENITWQLHVPETWQVRDWESSLQFREERVAAWPASASLQTYLQVEGERQKQKTKEAESLFNMGTEFLDKGVPQQARRAYQAAWKLSPQDAAFNEDARVQFQNLKMQQAFLGLNERRQNVFDLQDKHDGKAPRSAFNRWVPGQSPDYTQDQAKQIMQKNPQEENAALQRLAEKLIRQQDARLGRPESIRAALPTLGKQLTFIGSLQLQTEGWSELRVKLDAKTKGPGQWVGAACVLAGLFVCLLVLAFLVREPARMEQAR